MKGQGPHKLLVLDIALNHKITPRSLPKLNYFKMLKKLSISGTGIEESVLPKQYTLFPLALTITNSGWIFNYGLWNRWMDLFCLKEESVDDEPLRKRRRCEIKQHFIL